MKLKTLLGPYILAEPLNADAEQKTKGGLIVPPTAWNNNNFMLAKVVHVGQGYPESGGTYRPLIFKVGDIVMYLKSRGGDFEWEGRKVVYLQEHEFSGIMEED